MKKFLITLTLFFSVIPALAEVNPEEIANNILQDIVSISPRSGLSQDNIFEKEFRIHLYAAALKTKDNKLKALLALKAIKEIPVILKEEQKPLTQAEKIKILNRNTDYILLKKWFFELSNLK